MDMEERAIPNGEYVDRNLENSAMQGDSNNPKKVQMKKNSKENVKKQYVGYRIWTKHKLGKKDRGIGLLNNMIKNDSSLTKYHIEDLKERIAKLENDKSIIILNEERYLTGRFHRWTSKPIKLIKNVFLAIYNKIKDYQSDINIDTDFDRSNIESMINEEFSNSTSAETHDETVSSQINQTVSMPNLEPEFKGPTVISDNLVPEQQVGTVISTPSLEAVSPGYSVFDEGGDELMVVPSNTAELGMNFSLDGLNQFNQLDQLGETSTDVREKPIVPPNKDSLEESAQPVKLDGELEDVLTEVAKRYQDVIKKQQELQNDVAEKQREENEAKKVAEQAEEAAKEAAEKETDADKRKAKLEESLKQTIDKISERIDSMQKQNDALEATIGQSSTNIDNYKKQTEDSNARKEDTMKRVGEKEEAANKMYSRIDELQVMLGLNNTEAVQQNSVAQNQTSSISATSTNDMEQMMAQYSRNSSNSNLDLNTMLNSPQRVDTPSAGRGARR